MVKKTELDQLIWYLLRGKQLGFKICKTIQEGVSYKRTIPKSFWNDEDKGFYGILGLKNLTKKEMRKVHSEVVERIIQEINEPGESKMYADNYSRLFHALTILRIPKCDMRIPAIGTNYMYNIAYDLWALDDGKQSTYEFVSNVAWYSSEAVKENNIESEELLIGRRHTFNIIC